MGMLQSLSEIVLEAFGVVEKPFRECLGNLLGLLSDCCSAVLGLEVLLGLSWSALRTASRTKQGVLIWRREHDVFVCMRHLDKAT